MVAIVFPFGKMSTESDQAQSERFTRVDADTMEYQFTLEDPSKFTRPWTAVIPLTTNQAERGVTVGQMYEYACHEGNYAIANILRGGREQGGQE